MDRIISLMSFKKQLRISIMGLDSAGKTSIINKLKKRTAVSVVPTEGFKVHRVKTKKAILEICDTGGQDSIRPLWRYYLKSISGLIFVIDCNDVDRFNEVKQELANIISYEPEEKFPILIMANKQDLPGALKSHQIICSLDLSSLESHKWFVQSSSAKTGEGLKEGLKWLVDNRKEDRFVNH